MPSPPFPTAAVFLLVHRDAELRARFLSATGSQGLAEDCAEKALKHLRRERIAVLILGQDQPELSAAELIACLPAAEDGGPQVLLEASSPPAEAISRRLFFHFKPGLSGGLLIQLASAAGGRRLERFPSPAEELDREHASALRRSISIVRRLAEEPSLAGVEAAVELALVDFLRASRGRLWFFDGGAGELWRERETDAPAENGPAAEALQPAVRGLTGYAARTRRGLLVERGGEHPLYVPELDDPRGDGDGSLLIQPVVDASAEVHAVLVAAREASLPSFTEVDLTAATFLAEQLAIFLVQFGRQLQADAILEAPPPRRTGQAELFRKEAVRAMEEGAGEGQVIRISPAWIGWAQAVLYLTMAALGLYVVLGTVDEYAGGPAIVRVDGHTEVSATDAGTLAALEVEPGDSVSSGQVIGRFHSERETAELEGARRAFDEHLLRLLSDPADAATEKALTDLWAQRELASARLEQRLIRAPQAGIVTDLRARPGDYLAPGDGIASLAEAGDSVQLVALLPGGSRPKLRAGMPMRVRLEEYPGIELEMAVAWIGEEVVGPGEAQRYLGRRVADSVDLSGPIVLAEARLPDRTFEVDEKTYEMFDGMHGKVEVNVETHSILVTLLPVLKQWSWR